MQLIVLYMFCYYWPIVSLELIKTGSITLCFAKTVRGDDPCLTHFCACVVLCVSCLSNVLCVILFGNWLFATYKGPRDIKRVFSAGAA